MEIKNLFGLRNNNGGQGEPPEGLRALAMTLARDVQAHFAHKDMTETVQAFVDALRATGNLNFSQLTVSTFDNMTWNNGQGVRTISIAFKDRPLENDPDRHESIDFFITNDVIYVKRVHDKDHRSAILMARCNTKITETSEAILCDGGRTGKIPLDQRCRDIYAALDVALIKFFKPHMTYHEVSVVANHLCNPQSTSQLDAAAPSSALPVLRK